MKNSLWHDFVKGIWKENPVLVLLLGTCPTLAVTSSASNGLGMGLATTCVLIGSNAVISIIAGITPQKIRIPVYIVVIATFVTVVHLLMQAYAPPALCQSLGIFIPLIVVNCIILGRAEAYANKHTPLLSVMDGLGMGIGFTIALTIAGLIREILGNGTAFGVSLLPGFDPIGIFIQPPGAFLVIAFMIAVMNAIGIKTRQRKLVEGGCDGMCAKCTSACDKNGEVSRK